MTRTLVAILSLIAMSAASPAGAAGKSVKAKSRAPVPKSTIVDIVAWAGAGGETRLLRDLIDFDTQPAANDWALYAQQRAAIRACHAERYATAKDNVLSGRSSPLRDC